MMTISARFPFEYFILNDIVREGPILCKIGPNLVREWVRDGDGQTYRFAGLALRDSNGRLNVGVLRSNEWIVTPDLIYAREAI
ncbi:MULTISPECIES: hypothetical protein [Rhizobium]|uniref:Uncharacterized protein n=1 Tax=Rhizobium paranaense TaxID=1650438 RepID=A0A7W9D5H5_9HYPH|nr:hypothetical protein [Rhizobium paranaense]MBB5577986.1 hypothetical protein [Rhizobium paranaense]